MFVDNVAAKGEKGRSMNLEELDGRFGEAWSGEPPNGSNLNLVVARRGSPTAAAAAGAMAQAVPGPSFLACLGRGILVRPVTVIRNKMPIDNDEIAAFAWGAAQIGIGQGVCDAIAEGLIEEALVDELVLLVAVWVDPRAQDHTAVRLANRDATKCALADALVPSHLEHVRALVARRDDATNAYYWGE
jgi:5,6,7,8-tetrahydromethanopterin hydro-lyase